ncbi:hypothetical protein KFK09_025854 [Dendrobium nobile]|uniref:Myb/SANT-like domain-containing protein n=1 Tax=Dendrobium nobile TaxID=94219 RepID=A0A8T3A6J8_DENNO|nr:hypothetical protein KFK09_025854 [Dendrobium nobile]
MQIQISRYLEAAGDEKRAVFAVNPGFRKSANSADLACYPRERTAHAHARPYSLVSSSRYYKPTVHLLSFALPAVEQSPVEETSDVSRANRQQSGVIVRHCVSNMTPEEDVDSSGTYRETNCKHSSLLHDHISFALDKSSWLTTNDNESSNMNYLASTRNKNSKIHFSNAKMKRFLKGKVAQRSSANTQADIMDDLDVKLGNSNKNILRTPRWPDQHNEVFGELLFEQYLCGNIIDGILLEGNYTENSAQIRFKNMKVDFRAVFQLANRSGWGWDENLHLPIASDDIWDEIIQENPKLAKYRRNPFHQYEIFEKICGDNIAVGTLARSSRKTNKSIEEVVPGGDVEEDVFLSGNGISFVPTDLESNQIPEGENTEEPQTIPMSRSKRSSDDDIRNSRRPRRRAEKVKLTSVLDKHCVKTDQIIEKIDKICPYTTTQCLAKLSNIENISMEAIIAVHQALIECNDHKIAFMTWDRPLLHGWIEYILHNHPKFSGCSVWLPK